LKLVHKCKSWSHSHHANLVASVMPTIIGTRQNTAMEVEWNSREQSTFNDLQNRTFYWVI